MPDMLAPSAESVGVAATTASLDRQLHAWQSRFTGGCFPRTLGLAWLDRAAHTANTPLQTADLGRTAAAQWMRLGHVALGQESPVMPAPDDHRFADPAWQKRPFDLITQAVLLGEAWWDSVARAPGGVSRPNERIVVFITRQMLDVVSPSNVPWLNPEVIEATRATGGRNLLAGFSNFLCDQSLSAEAAGLVLGGSVPIILTSPADSASTRLASCALAVLAARGTKR